MSISKVSYEFLNDLPKCEHHLHLEGTLEPELLFTLAKRNGIELAKEFPQTLEALMERYKHFADLQDFLNYYYIGTSVLITEEDFYDLAWAYLERAASQGLVHAEVFFDPQSHTSRSVSIETVVRGFERALKRAETELGVSSCLIMCLLRHESPAACLETVKSATNLMSPRGPIVGLGLDSAERPNPPKWFAECYDPKNHDGANLKFTAHAGEEGPAEYVQDSLDILHVTRIDHGFHAADDPELLKRLARERVMLTVCPLSNVKLQVVSSVDQLPLDTLLEYDVPFSLNSDDPAYFGGYILENYIAVARAFPHWDHNTFVKIVKNAIKGSWCDDKRKEELLAKVDKVVESYNLD